MKELMGKAIEKSGNLEGKESAKLPGKIQLEPNPDMAKGTSFEALLEKNREKQEGVTSQENTEETEMATGLTEDEKAKVKEATGWSDEVIDAIGSMKEAEIYRKANLQEVEINGKKVLIREDIDMNQEDEDGITNQQRMERGRPPLTKDGEVVELHHIGQKPDSPLAELTTAEHRGVGNDTILHDKTKESEIDRTEFSKERNEHWKARVKAMEGAE